MRQRSKHSERTPNFGPPVNFAFEYSRSWTVLANQLENLSIIMKEETIGDCGPIDARSLFGEVDPPGRGLLDGAEVQPLGPDRSNG